MKFTRMKIKQNVKLPIITCSILLIFIIFLIHHSNISIFKKNTTKNNSSKTYDVALISKNDSTADNQYLSECRKAVDSACKKLNKNCKYYYTDNYKSLDDTVAAAAANGAVLIILPNSDYLEGVYNVQNNYTNTYFLTVDGIPHNKDNTDSKINYNVIPLIYDESEAGFLAGYASVINGYNKLAYIGKSDDHSAVNYGYGFLQGANYAASVTCSTNIDIYYKYLTSDDNVKDNADSLYDNDIQIITAYGNEIINGVYKSADNKGKYMITCNEKLDSDSPSLIGSATKNIQSSVSDAIIDFFNTNTQPKTNDDTVKVTSTVNNGVSLTYNEKIFDKFSKDDYNNLCSELAASSIKIISDSTVSPEELGLENINIIK